MIREPAVSGQFYSEDPRHLRETLQSFLGGPQATLEAKAIISPHAGYVYSGAVAGAVFSAVSIPDLIIVLGPNHYGKGLPLALFPEGQWRTPLGLAQIDADLNRRLLEECPMLEEDTVAHAREHSLEVQIPFLQMRSSGFRFAAICVATSEFATLEALGRAMGRVIRSHGERILIVCSSDMNHYESAERTSEKDRLAIDKVLALDPEGLFRVVFDKDIGMCGVAPAVAGLTACRSLEATEGKLIRYSHSGEVNGNFDRVVGYAGMVVL